MRNYLKAYAFHGVLASPYSDKDALGNCRFCEDDGHFSININDGRYRCLKCERRGNLYTFLQTLQTQLEETTTTKQYRMLSKDRGISPLTLKKAGLAWDPLEDTWVLPVVTKIVSRDSVETKYSITNLKRLVTNKGKQKLFGTPTCKANIYEPIRLDQSTQVKDVYLCEGEWDTLALLDIKDSIPALVKSRIVGLPGACSFTETLNDLPRVPFIWLGDHDHAGRSGSRLFSRKMKSWNRNDFKILNWEDYLPEELDDNLGQDDERTRTPIGYDIRDLVNSGLSPEAVWSYLRKNQA